MTVFDYIVIVLIAIGAVYGLRKGLVCMVAGFLSIYLGIVLAHCFSGVLCEWIAPVVAADEKTIKAISFAILILLAIIGAALLSKLITNLLDAVALGLVNRMGGLIVGALLCSLLIGGLLSVFDELNSVTPMVDVEVLSGTVMYTPLTGMIDLLLPFIQ